ncbi:hypothetical protein LCGC14_0913690 [marine sediment metagenome]|uniref:Uncharacterized protein n=1 Tax=marine sediment metagenome TaxID=412755 RepID=A0A0F9RBK8_9ZZZZ
MNLTTRVLPALTKVTGEQNVITIAAGQRLTIETSPGGAEILDAIVPVGKVWTAAISVSIDEMDA